MDQSGWMESSWRLERSGGSDGDGDEDCGGAGGHVRAASREGQEPPASLDSHVLSHRVLWPPGNSHAFWNHDGPVIHKGIEGNLGNPSKDVSNFQLTNNSDFLLFFLNHLTI